MKAEVQKVIAQWWV